MKFWKMNLKLVYIYIYIYIYKTWILKFQKWKLKKLYSEFSKLWNFKRNGILENLFEVSI